MFCPKMKRSCIHVVRRACSNLVKEPVDPYAFKLDCIRMESSHDLEDYWMRACPMEVEEEQDSTTQRIAKSIVESANSKKIPELSLYYALEKRLGGELVVVTSSLSKASNPDPIEYTGSEVHYSLMIYARGLLYDLKGVHPISNNNYMITPFDAFLQKNPMEANQLFEGILL